MVTKFNDDRVSIEPAPAKSGGKVDIKYQGLLNNDGAAKVYLHYGFDGWKDIKTTEMEHLDIGGFGAEIHASADKKINFCFKDCADNWDNNNGWNWECKIV